MMIAGPELDNSHGSSSQLPAGQMIRRVSLGMATELSKNPIHKLRNEFKETVKRFSVDGTADTRKQSGSSTSNMEITAPMERIFTVLNRLKASVSGDASADIDYLIKELSSSDVYTPNIDIELPKVSSEDTEFSDYMEGFLRPEKAIKFNRNRRDITAGKQLALNLKNAMNSDPSQVNELLETMAPPIAVFSHNAGQVIKSGFLTKSSCSDSSIWNRRYFIMDDSCMYYYKNKNPETRPAGVIGLHDYDFCEVFEKDKLYGFEMKNTAHSDVRVYHCYADSKETTDAWVTIIKEQIKIVKYFSSVEDGSEEPRVSAAFPEYRKRSYSETASSNALLKSGLGGVDLEDLYEDDSDDSAEDNHVLDIQGPGLRRLDSIVARNAEEQMKSLRQREPPKTREKKLRRRLRRPFEELESLSFNIFVVSDICDGVSIFKFFCCWTFF